jgi:hypothetical protein
VDADLQLDPDPFADDPQALARWTLECMAIERAVRSAMRSAVKLESGALESGVYPAFGASLEADEDTFDGLV